MRIGNCFTACLLYGVVAGDYEHLAAKETCVQYMFDNVVDSAYDKSDMFAIMTEIQERFSSVYGGNMQKHYFAVSLTGDRPVVNSQKYSPNSNDCIRISSPWKKYSFKEISPVLLADARIYRPTRGADSPTDAISNLAYLGETFKDSDCHKFLVLVTSLPSNFDGSDLPPYNQPMVGSMSKKLPRSFSYGIVCDTSYEMVSVDDAVDILAAKGIKVVVATSDKLSEYYEDLLRREDADNYGVQSIVFDPKQPAANAKHIVDAMASLLDSKIIEIGPIGGGDPEQPVRPTDPTRPVEPTDPEPENSGDSQGGTNIFMTIGVAVAAMSGLGSGAMGIYYLSRGSDGTHITPPIDVSSYEPMKSDLENAISVDLL